MADLAAPVPEYLNTLNSIDPSAARWKILVVDEYTHKMLLSLFSQFEILDTGIQRASWLASAVSRRLVGPQELA